MCYYSIGRQTLRGLARPTRNPVFAKADRIRTARDQENGQELEAIGKK